MTVNISARGLQLLIDGVNYTNYLTVWDVGDSQVQEEGLMLTQGQITLQATRGAVNLNPRTNTDFARGNIVILNIPNSSGVLTRHPRGHLRILSATPDFDLNSLDIRLGCALTLFSAEDSPGVKGCVTVGTDTDRTDIINDLLTSAGTGLTLSDAITAYPINYPLTTESGNCIQMAGKIAHSAGYVLWQDGTGTIRAKNKAPMPSPLLTLYQSTDLVSYKPQQANEGAASKLVGTGTITTVEALDRNPDPVTTFYPDGGYDLFEESINFAHTIHTMTQTSYRPKIGTTIITTIKQYEPITLPPPCEPDPNNKGRLLQITEEISEPTVEAMREWTANFPNSGITAFGNTVSRRAITQYTYNDISANTPGDVLTISKTEYLLKGKIAPTEQWGGNQTIGYFNASFLTESSVSFQTWGNSIKGGVQYLIQQKKDARALIDRGTSVLTSAQKIQLVVDSSVPARQESATGQLNPPAPETAPAPFSIKTEPLETTKTLTPIVGTFPQKQRVYQFDYLMGISDIADTPLVEAQLQALLDIEARHLNGRIDPCEFQTAIYDALLTGYQPMCRIDIVERDGTVVGYLTDGVAWVVTQTELGMAGRGLSLGVVSAGVPTPPYTGTYPPLTYSGISDIQWSGLTEEEWLVLDG